MANTSKYKTTPCKGSAALLPPLSLGELKPALSTGSWRKPPVDVTVQGLRDFMTARGADVSVLTTWTHETNQFQFVTVGSNRIYADAAVELRNTLTKNLGVEALGPITEDLRGDHPNVSLTEAELDFMRLLLKRNASAPEYMAISEKLAAARKACRSHWHTTNECSADL